MLHINARRWLSAEATEFFNLIKVVIIPLFPRKIVDIMH